MRHRRRPAPIPPCKHGLDPLTCLDCIAVSQGCDTPEQVQRFKDECSYWEEFYAREAAKEGARS